MQQWKCPICNWDNLNYWSVEFYDDQCYFPRECEDCKTEWQEWYQMEFTWHENLYDKDWKEMREKDLFVNQLKNENI